MIATSTAPAITRRHGTGGTTASLGGVHRGSQAARGAAPRGGRAGTVSSRPSRTSSGFSVARGTPLRASFRDGLVPAPERERPLDLPAGVGLGGPYQPDQDPDHREQEAGGEPGLLAVALPGGQPRGDDGRDQPAVQEIQRLGPDDRDYGGHPPRYAFCTSGFSRRFSEL